MVETDVERVGIAFYEVSPLSTQPAEHSTTVLLALCP